MRELFVYWKVRREHGVRAQQAAQLLLQRLRQWQPALQCCLMRRGDGSGSGGDSGAHSGDMLTFMETYRCALPGGIDAEMQAGIEAAAAAAFADLGEPLRHVEVFERLDPPG